MILHVYIQKDKETDKRIQRTLFPHQFQRFLVADTSSE